jgi:hypothetical protein
MLPGYISDSGSARSITGSDDELDLYARVTYTNKRSIKGIMHY